MDPTSAMYLRGVESLDTNITSDATLNVTSNLTTVADVANQANQTELNAASSNLSEAVNMSEALAMNETEITASNASEALNESEISASNSTSETEAVVADSLDASVASNATSEDDLGMNASANETEDVGVNASTNETEDVLLNMTPQSRTVDDLILEAKMRWHASSAANPELEDALSQEEEDMEDQLRRERIAVDEGEDFDEFDDDDDEEDWEEDGEEAEPEVAEFDESDLRYDDFGNWKFKDDDGEHFQPLGDFDEDEALDGVELD